MNLHTAVAVRLLVSTVSLILSFVSIFSCTTTRCAYKSSCNIWHGCDGCHFTASCCHVHYRPLWWWNCRCRTVIRVSVIQKNKLIYVLLYTYIYYLLKSRRSYFFNEVGKMLSRKERWRTMSDREVIGCVCVCERLSLASINEAKSLSNKHNEL